MSSLQDMSNFLFISMTTGHKVAQHIRGKTCAGTILPSFEHNCLK